MIQQAATHHPGYKNTSNQFIKAIRENTKESRRECLSLRMMGEAQQRLDYLHENPVRSGLVWEPQQYKYSSATDYYTNQHGVLPVQHLYF